MHVKKGVEKGVVNTVMSRSLCKQCKKRPVAINYYKGKKPYYRSKCDSCASGRSPGVPFWHKAGYRQKTKCDKCGFSSKHKQQFNVYHIDGSLTNCKHSNLKTICANCQRLMQETGAIWKQGDLTPDF